MPKWRHAGLALDRSGSLICKDFSSVRTCSRLAAGLHITKCRSELNSLHGDAPMHGELINIPTDSLIDMLFVILTGELPVTTTDGTEIEQIQRELQRRGEDKHWSFCTVN